MTLRQRHRRKLLRIQAREQAGWHLGRLGGVNIVRIGRMHSSILGAGFAGALALLVSLDAASAPACTAPQRVLERFIEADCDRCWGMPEPATLAGSTWVLDWITPGSQGETAPLAAAALPEARERLAMRAGLAPKDGSARAEQPLTASGLRIRVTGGPAWNGYLGLQLDAQGRSPAGARAYLALVEEIPAGAEGNPSARRLVRAVAGPIALDGPHTVELRALRIPDGAKPDRLRGMTWWVTADGLIGGIAAERCPR